MRYSLNMRASQLAIIQCPYCDAVEQSFNVHTLSMLFECSLNSLFRYPIVMWCIRVQSRCIRVHLLHTYAASYIALYSPQATAIRLYSIHIIYSIDIIYSVRLISSIQSTCLHIIYSVHLLTIFSSEHTIEKMP